MLPPLYNKVGTTCVQALFALVGRNKLFCKYCIVRKLFSIFKQNDHKIKKSTTTVNTFQYNLVIYLLTFLIYSSLLTTSGANPLL